MRAMGLALCALAVSGCTPRLWEAAKPVQKQAPPQSRGIELESAALAPSGLLVLCVIVREGSEPASRHTLEADRPTAGRAKLLLETVEGHAVLVGHSFHSLPGCAQTGVPLPVVHLRDPKSLELPPGADEAIYTYSDETHWALGYVSRQPLFEGHYSVDFDLSRTKLFAYTSHKPQLLLVFLPVTATVDAMAVATTLVLALPFLPMALGVMAEQHGSHPSADIPVPLASKEVEAESAAVDGSGNLRICVVVRDATGAHHRLVSARRPSARIRYESRTEAGSQRHILVDDEVRVAEDCDPTNAPTVPVVRLVDYSAFEMPEGSPEAVYSVVNDAGWELGYFSEAPIVNLRRSVAFDLSHTPLFLVPAQ